MVSAKSSIKFTYADYKSLPESMSERYELLDGELIMVPAPTTTHQRVSRNLGHLLWAFIREHELGEIFYAPCDVVLGQGDERNVVQPDLLFVAKGRADIIVLEEIRGAPDLVVEILSPGTEEQDRSYKNTLYARSGVKEYWLVDPDAKSVELLCRGEKGLELHRTFKQTDTFTSKLIEGLAIELNQVF